MVNDNKMLRFRESFRGYNKDDVNQYIEQLYINFSRKEAEYQARISGLTMNAPARSGDLSGKLAEAQNEIAELKKQLEDARGLNAEVSETDEKSKLYDSMSSRVGNILIVANNNAEKLVSDAENEADRIRAEAQTEADMIKSNARAEADGMLREFETKLRSVSDGCLNDYLEVMKDAENKLNTLTDVLKANSDKLFENISTKSKRLENEITGLCTAVNN